MGEHEVAAHTASTVKDQKEMDTGPLLTSSFVLYPEPQPMVVLLILMSMCVSALQLVLSEGSP